MFAHEINIAQENGTGRVAQENGTGRLAQENGTGRAHENGTGRSFHRSLLAAAVALSVWTSVQANDDVVLTITENQDLIVSYHDDQGRVYLGSGAICGELSTILLKPIRLPNAVEYGTGNLKSGAPVAEAQEYGTGNAVEYGTGNINGGTASAVEYGTGNVDGGTASAVEYGTGNVDGGTGGYVSCFDKVGTPVSEAQEYGTGNAVEYGTGNVDGGASSAVEYGTGNASGNASGNITTNWRTGSLNPGDQLLEVVIDGNNLYGVITDLDSGTDLVFEKVLSQ